MDLKFTYIKGPLNKYTFVNKDIKGWVEKHIEGLVLNLFAGSTLLNCDEIRNDINKDMLADYHMDALDFCKWWHWNKFDTIILDPPYSLRKSMEKYQGHISSPFNKLKNELLYIIKPNGIVITFGYHSVVMGKKRNFIQEHILLISHGGAIHDTIGTIERYKKPLVVF